MNPCRFLVLICVLWLPRAGRAQDSSLAEADLAYSRTRVDSSRFVAKVKMQVGEHAFIRYTCEYDPRRAQVTTADGTSYVRGANKTWVQSRDGEPTGTAVGGETAAKLDDDVQRTLLPWVPAILHDKPQGRSVWKLVGRNKTGGCERFVYERSRERPHPDGVYPRFTFVKHLGDADGRLLLQNYTAQLHDHGVLNPIEVSYDFGAK